MISTAPSAQAAIPADGPRRTSIVATVLAVLAAAFLARVVAQLAQAVTTVSFLPAFDAWQSGALPYPVLLGSQLLILAVQAVVIRRAASGSLRLSTGRRRALALLGGLYFAAMVGRGVAGLTVLDGHGWFDAPLPTVFHLVLASFVLVTAYGLPATGGERR